MRDYADKDWLDYESDEDGETLLESIAAFVSFIVSILSIVTLLYVIS